MQTPPELVVGQTAAFFAQQRFGTRLVGLTSRPSASTTPTTILGPDAKRLFWMVVNRGATDVNLDFGTPAAAGNGVLLAAGGGFASMQVDEDADTVTYFVSVVAASGTPQLWVYTLAAV
jgi:hypothetical protein